MAKKVNENKDKFIKAFQARRMLFLTGFLTHSEADKVFKRLCKFQDKHKIEVSEKELNRVTH